MPNKSKIYLDHNATTAPSFEVKAELPAFLEEFGNPSSIHWAARGPKAVLRETRKTVAESLGVSPLEIIFTSGGSEGNNAVIKSIFALLPAPEWKFKLGGRTEFITTQVEHPSVLKTFQWIESHGATVHYLRVSRDGQLDLEQYLSVLSEKTALVSVMVANNETGVIFPVAKLARMAHDVGAYFHADCVQALGKIPLQLSDLGVDFATFSAHKFYALKGSGFLFVKKGSPFEPLVQGGGQERYRRGGTENTLGIFSIGIQIAKLGQTSDRAAKMQILRDLFETCILSEISGVTVTSGAAPRLSNTSSLVIKNVDGETLLMSLDIKGFAVSTGAACSSGSPEPSPVLLAIGLSREEAQSSLRVSLGWETTEAEILEFVEILKAVVTHVRSLNGEGASLNVS